MREAYVSTRDLALFIEPQIRYRLDPFQLPVLLAMTGEGPDQGIKLCCLILRHIKSELSGKRDLMCRTKELDICYRG